jgi:hypothetical protein
MDGFGRDLHALQDTFSHDGFDWWLLGHVPDSVLAEVLHEMGVDAADTDTYGTQQYLTRDQLMEAATRSFLDLWADTHRNLSP